MLIFLQIMAFPGCYLSPTSHIFLIYYCYYYFEIICCCTLVAKDVAISYTHMLPFGIWMTFYVPKWEWRWSGSSWVQCNLVSRGLLFIPSTGWLVWSGPWFPKRPYCSDGLRLRTKNSAKIIIAWTLFQETGSAVWSKGWLRCMTFFSGIQMLPLPHGFTMLIKLITSMLVAIFPEAY